MKEGFAVKKSRFSVEQIVGILKQVEVGVPVSGICRQAGITEQTFYRWKKLYVGWEVDQIRQLKQLQERKRAAEEAGGRAEPGQGHVAGRTRKKILKPSQRRPVVEYLSGAYRISQRRACWVVRLDRTTHRYQ